MRQVLRAAGLAAALSGGCAQVGGAAAGEAEAGPAGFDAGRLGDLGAIPGDFLARQRLSGAMGGRSLAGDVVVQKRGETLTIVGLTPFGTQAFAVIQRGAAVEVVAGPGGAPPFPPELMLADVHRALFAGLGAGLADGARRGRRAGEVIRETWSEGKLIRRTFRERRRGRPRGLVVVDYGAGMAGGRPPPVIEIDNQRLGYRVRIETLSFEALAAVGGP